MDRDHNKVCDYFNVEAWNSMNLAIFYFLNQNFGSNSARSRFENQSTLHNLVPMGWHNKQMKFHKFVRATLFVPKIKKIKDHLMNLDINF